MFWTRLISGVVMVIVALATMWLGGPWLAGILLLISLAGYRELTKAQKVNNADKGLNGVEFIGLVGVVVYYVAMYFWQDTTSMLMCIVLVFMAEMFLYVVQFPRYRAEQIAAAIFSFLYAPVMLSFMYMTRMSRMGMYLVWLILISSWGCDTCAYCVGKLIGRKKIFPVLSPHKSLEGCIGGVAGAALIGGLYAYFVVEPRVPEQDVLWAIVFISAVGALMSMVGDLAASAIKRNYQIKDYGKLLPGHGGIMDRFDSMVVTAPMIYFLSVLLIHAAG
ncbi:MAG: phosphatidate cytidylyltransferase [bacterium]|nr:phosphatidate cytidylyltransferase [bacterium]MCM1375122.1 phosphatidate cytidylyltransferase [Muribaculum sp.]